MHFALPTLAHGGRHSSRSVTVIRRRASKRNSRSWLAGLLILVVGVGTAGVVLAAGAFRSLPVLGHVMAVANAASAESGPVDDGPVPLTVRIEPPGARVVLDGRVRGRTPLELHTAAGRHVVQLDADNSIDTLEPIDVTATGTFLDVALWSRQPTVRRLRPAYPGA